MENKKDSVRVLKTAEECRDFVAEHARQTLKFKRAEQAMNSLKNKFNKAMELYFEENDCESPLKFENVPLHGADDAEVYALSVSRVQRVDVTWDADKVAAALGKKLASEVISKRYEITDMSGLVAYLKECGVDPKVFKSFIRAEKTVNQKELDALEELGKIDASDLEGCYETKVRDPYFTIRVKKDL